MDLESRLQGPYTGWPFSSSEQVERDSASLVLPFLLVTN